VLLPETDLTGAGLLAERMRRQIAELEIVVHERPIKVTASIGVMQLPANDTRVEPALAMLDRLTLEAKRRGRNRIVTGTVVDA
jgi:diguanylate cyclase (GGDEF)-like protein